MTAPTPPAVEIGDVIVPLDAIRRPFAAMSPFTIKVTVANANECRELVASGRWVKVEEKGTSDAN